MQPAPPEASTCPTCGSVLEETPSGELGCMSCLLGVGLGSEEETVHDPTPGALGGRMRFGVYEIDHREDGSLHELGRGAMGITYRATDTSLQRKVALKIIKTDLAERSADARERFMREARAAAALRHENIATVYQFGMRFETGQYFYAMELIEGETLNERVHRAGPLDARTTVGIAQQVTSALAAAEKRGLIHRDLKPANLMLLSADDDEVVGISRHAIPTVKIIDFGLAKAIHNQTDPKSLTHDRFVGTPAFASPEQFEHSALDVRSDIYSLGQTLWFALTGRTPFSGRTMEEIHRAQKSNALPIEQLKTAHVSSRLRSLLESMLAFEPAARPGIHYLAAQLRVYQQQDKRTRARQKSIAVLPLENLSVDPENTFFADGVHAEILTHLSKIAGFKVISRNSVMTYERGVKRNLREIAKELGVAHLVQGSVQRAGDQVRINVQLIKAQTDTHLWADTFDRKLTDVFAIESEIAKRIAESLQAKLTGREEKAFAVKPTNNPEAYDAYLRGLAYTLKTGNTANTLGAQKYLKEAVRLDPKFAVAWALLSKIASFGYLSTLLPPTVTLREEARQAAETALTLQPNLGEALLAKGEYHYACLKDYDTAMRYFEEARHLLPSSSWIPEFLAYVTRRRGQWDQSESYFKDAERLDPRNVRLLSEHVVSYVNLRRFTEALRKVDQILNIIPDDVGALATKAAIAQAQGDLPRAAALLAPLRPVAETQALETQVYQAILERQPAPMIARLKEILAKPDHALGYLNGKLRFWLGWAQEVAGDHAAAQETWRQARSELESFFKEQPDNVLLINNLALINMGLGDKTSAFAFVEKGMTLVPIDKDALYGTQAIEILSRVAARMGEPDRAIAALEKLLSIPGQGTLAEYMSLTPALLRLDPMFDLLRSDPRFQKLCEEKQPLLSSPTQIPEKGIAVLPFENLSEEKANAYFAQGIQNEILTRLASVRDLKVISRTSTAKYQSNPGNLKTVAEELGVSTILEGAVRKAGDKVRVNVHLIDALADAHLWAKSYDRDFKDVLRLESEVAQEIAEALQAKLSPSESHVLASVRTHDTEAYDLFLRGEYELHQAESSFAPDAYDRADAFYRQALGRDPNFAEAAAALAHSRLLRHWEICPLEPAELDEVKSLIDRALALAPNLPEAHLALGLLFYWGHRQYEMALTEFNRTLELQPNSALARLGCALVYRRRGEWERSLADFQRAQELAPRDARIPRNIGNTYQALRLWKDAERAELRALAIDPHDAPAAAYLLGSRLNGTGDVDSARRVFDDFPEAIKSLNLVGHGNAASVGLVDAIISIPVYLDVMQKRFTDAFQALDKEVANDDRAHLQKLVGRVALRVLAGEREAAKSVGEEALPLLETRLKEQPDNTLAMTGLSWVYLALGRNADALRLSRQAADSLSIEKDAMAGPFFQIGVAQIEARAGAPEEAIKRLRRLLSTPAGQVVSVARLKIDPVWDPIRSRPDFQQLLSGSEQIGPNK
jgi:TolB-like protein/Tfp pilus assembly protein PilF/tRNA A-37 threonylcarbamoyl transferase component Bud32